MPSPATVPDFLSLVCKSGLLQTRDLESYLNQLREARRLPSAPAPLAGQMVRDGLLTAYQAEQLLNGRCRGFVLGKYRLLDRLGAGGMGTVFLAEHLHMKRQVAVKVLPSERAADPVYLGRFLREAQAAAALDHPNIVRAYDVETEGAMCFLVMEHVDGINLQDLVNRRGRLDVTRAAHYIRQAALGLHHAHEAGLVHRDIKPANLLVNRAGVVKLLDMGLARFFQDESDMLTKEHDGQTILGTADYLAPEQGRDSHDVDIRADIYSLGATFYFLLIGRAPFADGTLSQKLLWHQVKAPPEVRALRPEVPAELSALVAKMLAKAPQHRPQRPVEVAAALAEWTRTPIAPPSLDELRETGPSLRGPCSHRFADQPTVLKGAADAAAGSAPGGEMTNLDLGSASHATATESTAALPPPATDAGSATTDQDWSRIVEEDSTRSAPRFRLVVPRAWWWCAAALLVLIAAASGAWWMLSPRSVAPPPRAVAARPPTHLRATAEDSGAIELRWQTPAESDVRFQIERAADRKFTKERTTLATVESSVNRWTDATATRSKPSYYRVLAMSAAGESAASNVASPPPRYERGFLADGMVLNGGATIVGKALRLTDGRGNEARSAFYHQPVDVRSFTTRFRFQINPGPNTADGFTFCIQGIGPRRVGMGAGGLGYENLPMSVALKFDLWNNQGEGPNSTGLYTGGMSPQNTNSIDLKPSGIDLHSGQPYDVELVYVKRGLNVKISDVAAPAKVFRRRFPVDIPAEVRDTMAYVGFTGGTGGVGAVQDILHWTWETGGKD